MLLEQGTSLEEARALMRRAHVKLALIIRRDERFCGIVTASDLASIKVMRAAESARLRSAELTVEDVMTPRARLHAVDSVTLKSATVGDVLETMKRFGDQHMLVVDSRTREICGLISASDIARCLHIPLNITEKANSFSDIYRELHA
jgi:CBS domain-containing protein